MMKTRIYKNSMFCILLVLGSLKALYSQSHVELRFEKFKYANGNNELPTCLYEDSRQFIWLGTLAGLKMYDGYSIKTFTNNVKDSYSISDNKINSILEDNKGNLWIGTQNGLNYFDLQKKIFIRYTDTLKYGLPAKQIVKIKMGLLGKLWVRIPEGFFIYDSLQNKFQKTLIGIKLENNERITDFEFFGEQTLVATNKGLYIKENKDSKYIKLRPKEALGLLDSLYVSCIYKDKSDQSIVWLGTAKGLYRLDIGETRELKLVDSSLKDDAITVIIFKSINELFVGTLNHGLLLFNTESSKYQRYLQDPNNPESLPYNTISGALFSTNNILWISNNFLHTADLKKSQFRNTRAPKSDFDIAIPKYFELFEYGKDTLLMPREQGLNFFSTISKKYSPFPYKPDYNMEGWQSGLTCYFEEDNGLLWIGVCNGLFLFDRRLRRFVNLEDKFPELKQLREVCIRKIHKDSKDNIWIATWSYGVYKINFTTQSLRHYPLSAGFTFATRTIMEDRSGNIWVGTRGGLLKFPQAQDTFKLYKNDPKDSTSMSENTAFSIYEDASGTIWVGTYGGGLNKLDVKTDRFKHFTMNEGLIDNNVLSIFPDQKGNLWMSTFAGISVFNPKTEKINNFTTENGLLNPGMPSFIFGKGKHDGRHYYAGPNGIDYFYPDSIKLSPHKPKIWITDFKLFNKSVPISRDLNEKKSKFFSLPTDISFIKELKLPYDQNVITLEYCALDFSGPQSIQYAYQLEGFDKEWQFVDKQRSVTYTNLNPGSYNFKVKATNADGVWNEEPKELMIIKVSPPWWQTWWAVLLYIIFLLGAISGYIQYRSKALRRQNKKLEEKVEVRTIELNQTLSDLKNAQTQLIQSEKMASLGELTSGIAHEIKNPLNFINNFSEVNIELLSEIESEYVPKIPEAVKTTLEPILLNLIKNSERINQHGRRVDDIVKGMLQHSRLGNATKEPLNLNSICDEALKLAYHGFKAKDKTFDCRVVTEFDANLRLFNGVPQDVSRVILNIINNSFYACSKKQGKKDSDIIYIPTVLVSTKVMDKKVCVAISDNGIGIAPHIIHKIFQPFFTTKPTGEGTGLGLSLAYDIITKGHGGDIQAISPSKRLGQDLGEGTDFEINLPINT